MSKVHVTWTTPHVAFGIGGAPAWEVDLVEDVVKL